MKITFLGTGTSQGVPVIACPCEVCASSDLKDNRLRTSVMIEQGKTNIVIDSGPDFRQQMLRANVKRLDAVVFTHEHKDHIAGLDDVRAFNYFSGAHMDVYATTRVQEALRREYHYAFANNQYPGIPKFNLITIDNKDLIRIGDINLTPIEVLHYKLPVLGFRTGNFTYITDANFITDEEKEKIKGTEVLVINALRREQHISHYTLDEALALIAELKPKTAYLTHISHQLGLHAEVEKELPVNVHCAYDGLEIEMPDTP